MSLDQIYLLKIELFVYFGIVFLQENFFFNVYCNLYICKYRENYVENLDFNILKLKKN